MVGKRSVKTHGGRVDLTDRQRAILEFIESEVREHGRAPTLREIGRKFGIRSTNGVRTHLAALIRKGYLKRQGYLSRGIELTRDITREAGTLPLVGSVPAGKPIDAVENIEGEVAIDTAFLPRGEGFGLRVRGDSMSGAGILEGDIVLVRKQQDAQPGDIVVAIIDGEATVKRFFPEGRRIRLQPENPAYEPIVVDGKEADVRIAGKVVGLLRKL